MITWLDQKYDFSSYDQWSVSRPYNVHPGPDEKIDLMLVFFRYCQEPWFLPYSGVSDLGFTGYVFVDNFERFFYGGDGYAQDSGASGVTVTKRSGWFEITDYDWAFSIAAHEIMHKLYGDSHLTRLFGKLGLIGSSGSGRGMMSFEKACLGWMTYDVLDMTRDTILTLTDYMTTDRALLMPIPGARYYYYAVEWRAKIDEYDDAPVPGLYIYRIFNPPVNRQKRLTVESADGRWDWTLNENNRPVKLRPNPLGGRSKLEVIKINDKEYFADGNWGDEQDAFTLKRPLWSFYGNPTPDFIFDGDTIHTQFNLQIISVTDSTATIKTFHGAPAVLSVPDNAAAGFSVGTAYPNPASSEQQPVTLPIHVAEPGVLVFRVFDTRGKLIKQKSAPYYSAGEYNIHWTPHGVPAGLYFFVATFGAEHRTGKILYLPTSGSLLNN
ncbi:MAG: hypothetical protein GXO82_10475 [Chlorobi bacterium]|nr:hypothetical protein [Chlorobiota bacterium]